ncbi:MAG: YbaB/EbfC family nucleoid-associated protein [Lentisphaerae bacterium]|nr:YbaB/EbfC family nucleoid-associated protein [Lentisphaerota bacterium]
MAGFGDLMKIMSHAKELQANAAKLKEELPKMEFSSSTANGGVSVTVGGDFTVRNITIAPEMLGDKEYLERALSEALNSAFASARTAMQEQMKAVTGSLGIDLPAF